MNKEGMNFDVRAESKRFKIDQFLAYRKGERVRFPDEEPADGIALPSAPFSWARMAGR